MKNKSIRLQSPISGTALRSVVTLLLCCFVTLASAADKFVLVLDAGHGGKDAGCVGKISKEKTLTLRYAMAFGKIVERNCPDVKVVYTRTTDRFLELWQRAEIANKNKADLFVSVHINAVSKGSSVHGYQTYALGRGETTGKKGIQENLEVAKRENSVIYMEKDYKQRYQGFDNSAESNIMFEFIQDKNMERSVEMARFFQKSICAATGRIDKGAHQNNLAVLRLTSMPACLMELGFISNPDEERFMNAESSTDKYARGFLKAFINYKNKYFDGLHVPYRPQDIKDTQIPQVVPDEYKEKEQQKQQEQAAAAKKRSQPAQNVKETPKEAAKETPKDAPKETPKDAPKESPQDAPANAEIAPLMGAASQAPIFKIQILTGRTRIKTTDRQFKGLADVDCYEEGGLFKYTVGASADYNAIARQRREILDKFPEAFIIAFKNGQKMNVNEAISEFKKNKGK
ncbi:MAG: N-acetylmuramoyl-L-alanine amidase [Prevotella sp.]|nr:N-acetylmuramoyl-L-alanine amidase [Prevotella sp.]